MQDFGKVLSRWTDSLQAQYEKRSDGNKRQLTPKEERYFEKLRILEGRFEGALTAYWTTKQQTEAPVATALFDYCRLAGLSVNLKKHMHLDAVDLDRPLLQAGANPSDGSWPKETTIGARWRVTLGQATGWEKYLCG